MRFLRTLFGLTLCALGTATYASIWSYRGLEGANGTVVARAGNQLLLGTLQGLQVSTDDGGSWSRLASLPRWSYIRGILVDPADAQHWYVQFDELVPTGGSPQFYMEFINRVLETRDGGANWQALALPGETLALPIAHPVATSTLLIWYRDAAANANAMALSFDGGAHWTPTSRDIDDPGVQLGAALSGQHFVGLKYDYVPDGIDAKLYLSPDNVTSWSSPVATLRMSSLDILQLFPRASDAQQLFWADATTWGLPGRSGTVNLVTGAVTHFPDVPGLLSGMRDDPANPGTVLAQSLGGYAACDYCLREEVWALAPGATQWQVRGGIRHGAKRPNSDVAFGGLLRDGADQLWLTDPSTGVQHSNDAGATWNVRAGGMRDAAINAVAVDPRNAQRLLAARDLQSLQRSDDGGISWNDVGGQVPQDVRSLTRSPVDPDHLVAAAQGGLYRSRDAGLTWQPVATSIGPQPDGRGWRDVVWCANNDTHLMAQIGDTIYRSLDGGASWSSVTTTLSPRLESARRAPSRVYLLRSSSYAVTTDCGATFTELGGFGGYSRTLAVDPNDDLHLVSTGVPVPNQIPSLRVSSDGGVNWTTVVNPVYYSGLNGWIDACDRERYTTYDLRVLRGTTPELTPEPPARLSGINRANAVDSQCIAGQSVSVVGTRSGLWLRRASPDLLFADGFGLE
ncbi:hypothetical protein [Tahibacter sp.]|uniref:hypothetical protein n=1 Tax=Tahibacter sp. TaxID=2056211 RepID=UPI0028C39557|nr:hypothetical protein [Tahibacter sp.]